MTGRELIGIADTLRPNQYTEEQKLRWLRALDMMIYDELIATHDFDCAPERPSASPAADEELLAPEPYALELYCEYLFSRIDLNNAEITHYNQSGRLFSAAWRQLADHVNRTRRPRGAAIRI